jgi:signal transduction histidine kinase
MVFPAIVYGAILVLIFFVERDKLPDMNLNISTRELISAGVIGVAVFAISNISFVYQNTPFSVQYPIDVLNARTLADIGGFAILFTHYVSCCQSRAWHEVAALKNVLQNQYVQYRMSRESINLINQKYHDLKHQIEFLKSESDESRRQEYLESMEKGIKAYELQYKTGNVVLDTVFTSKAMYCEKHGITFTCVVDGTLLDFVDVMDLASIFGNALDNAIEYEKRIPVKEKRLIHVTVSRQKDFVLSRFENYYTGGSLSMINGLPETTKPDVAYHGYGLKSIRSTAEHYGGTASVNITNDWFVLNVLFPLRK